MKTLKDKEKESAEIKETDIVFDCPFCGKSLAIDFRGAGLNIACTDCGGIVEVPIPEGMEIADFDSSTEEQEILIINLRKSLALAEARIRDLEHEVQELSRRREDLEKSRTDNIYRFGAIGEKSGLIQKAVEEIVESARKIAEISKI